VRDFHRADCRRAEPRRAKCDGLWSSGREIRAERSWAMDEAKDDQKCIAWVRDFFRASAPYASAGAYVNFMTAEEGDRVAAAYGPSYERLVELKRRYDPENIFHLNQNIKP
jgi:FAD/FMN-containing dehydrogenase